ncbi:stage III sporulation protein AB [Eubacterium sp. MSJ-13]|nr:stage III sporulation protein AB [Eubacterium sp. MSJ-13]
MVGLYIWERYMLRVRVLEEWQRILIEISGEISYSAQSMSQLCVQISESCVYGKKFWSDIARKVEEKDAGLPGEFWREHLSEYKYMELLSAEDKNIIYQFGGSFGTLDIYSQINEIELFEKRLEQNLSEARQKMVEQKKVCIFMGVISGMMTGICLF